MIIERGSTWRKWDFHIHTPYSILNNQYGFNPYEKDEDTNSKFDEYVKELFSRAIDNEISAIGVADYFSIKGYKRIINDYLRNSTKMEALFPDADQRAQIQKIFVFPNIEFRIENVVAGNVVNYHVIFSDKVAIKDIEEGFLQRLEITHSPGKVLPLTDSSIEQIGKEFKAHNKADGSDYYVGLSKITIDYKNIFKVLNENSSFHDKYHIAIPVDDDLSKINWSGRDYQLRKMMYKQAHLLMTSNANTRKWALAEGEEESRKAEFGSIKPCIWGSDAHDYNRMFKPDNDRFCWIKADPTFDGLQQVLYEPDDRVRIQREQPEKKDEHQIIDHIIFCNDDFCEDPIYFSEGLNAIIGGKSTGKSILLRHIAKGIDPEQVKNKERNLHNDKQRLDTEAKVVWKDGMSGERRIIYIPQSWLNHVVDDTGGESQLNIMISDILLQQDEVHSAYGQLTDELKRINSEVTNDIKEYVGFKAKAEKCEKTLKETGRSNAFKSVIDKLKEQREELSKQAGITEEGLKEYTDLEQEITKNNTQLEEVLKEEPHVEFAEQPFVYIPSFTSIGYDEKGIYSYRELSITKSIFEETIHQMNEAVAGIWKANKEKATCILAEKKEGISKEIEALNERIAPLKEKVEANDQIKEIETQINEEDKKYRNALNIEKDKKGFEQDAEKKRKSIIESRDKIYLAYKEYSNRLSEMNSTDTDLEFEVEIGYKKQELFDAINGIFDQRNLRAFRENGYRFTDNDEFEVDDKMYETLWNGMDDKQLAFKGGYDLHSALEKLFSDWCYVHYIVKSGKDTIRSMSPGKKALVLLELIINLEKGNCPILIDQPEDDLDNRSIYTDLVTYLKKKKHERQIIVVTHNANVVVGADAEEIIIANQDGKETKNKQKRFEYRCGAIENNSPILDDFGVVVQGVLNEKGVQDQICDILEGGKDAFEKRQSKYYRVL